MKKLSLALVALTLSVPAVASTWKADGAHTSATFSAKHMMVSTVRGTLGAITTTLELDDKDLTKSKVEAVIDTTKLNTGVEKRDGHLKSPDFLDSAKFPNITFKSKKIEKAGDRYKVTGDLTIKDKTKEVVLDAMITAEVASPFPPKTPTRGVSATTTINREDWGLIWNMPVADGLLVSKEVKIEIEAEYLKEESKPAAKPAAKK